MRTITYFSIIMLGISACKNDDSLPSKKELKQALRTVSVEDGDIE